MCGNMFLQPIQLIPTSERYDEIEHDGEKIVVFLTLHRADKNIPTFS